MQNIILPKHLAPAQSQKDLTSPIVWLKVFMTKDHQFVSHTDPFVQKGYISNLNAEEIPDCLFVQDVPPSKHLYVVELVSLPGVFGYNSKVIDHISSIYRPEFVFTSSSIIFLLQFQKAFPTSVCMPFVHTIEPTESFFAKAKKNIANRIKHVASWSGFISREGGDIGEE